MRCPRTSPALPANASHLLMPDASALATYLEVFELAEVKGLVLLSSVMRQVRNMCKLHIVSTWMPAHPELHTLRLSHLVRVMTQLHAGGNMRRTERLRALYTDKRRGNHLFDNLHMLETAPRSQARYVYPAPS